VSHEAAAADGGAGRLPAGADPPGPAPRQVGYYDDDDDGAIVYLGAPFSSDAVRLKHSYIQKIDAKSAELEKWKRRYPWLAKQLGVP
jgi:hypothetical protein